MAQRAKKSSRQPPTAGKHVPSRFINVLIARDFLRPHALGLSCDGSDGDLFREGVTVCNAAGTGTTCNDVTPTNNETCDTLDNDCDSGTDEAGDSDADGVDDCCDAS